MGLISYNLWNQWRNGDIRYYQVKLGIVYYLVICEVYIYVFMLFIVILIFRVIGWILSNSVLSIDLLYFFLIICVGQVVLDEI